GCSTSRPQTRASLTSLVPEARERVVVVHEELLILLEHGVRELLGDLDDRAVVALLPARLEARAHRLGAEDLEIALRAGLVLVELPEQRLLANGLALGLLARIRHVPAVARLLDEPRVVLLEVAQVLVVRREVAVDLARHRTAPVVVEEALLEDGFELDRLLVLRPRLDLAHVLRRQVLEALGLVLQLLPHPLDGARL